MKKKTTEQDRAVAAVKAQVSPRVPCIHSDADGYCTGPCEGAICCSCQSYKPRATGHEPSAEPSAITVKACGEITFPPGVETLGEKANFLHAYSIEASKRSTGAAILAGWVLSVARSTCAHGQWVQWLQSNVSFSRMTAQNYLTLYAQTIGKQRAEMRRPIPLATPPTVEELEAAAHDVDGKALSALYKSTRLIAASANWGGAGRGQGRKPLDAETEAAELAAIPKLTQREEAAAIWTRVMCMIDKTSVLDAVPLLPQKAAKVCYDRLSELAKAMKSHLEEF